MFKRTVNGMPIVPWYGETRQSLAEAAGERPSVVRQWPQRHLPASSRVELHVLHELQGDVEVRPAERRVPAVQQRSHRRCRSYGS